MQEIEKIRAALQDRVILSVSDATGVNRNTLAAIRNGKQKTASKTTIKALQNYLGLTDDQ